MVTILKMLLVTLVLVPTTLGQVRVPERSSSTHAVGTVTRLFEVSDLTRRLDADVAQKALLDAAESGATDELEELRLAFDVATERANREALDLVEMIHAYALPTFEGGPNGLVDLVSGARDSLIVVGTRPQQEWVRSFLDIQRSETLVLDVQASVVTVPNGLLSAAGFEPGGAPVLLDEAAAQGVRASLEAGGARTLTSPRIHTWSRQRGQVSIARSQSFVMDYELRVVQPGDRKIADPIIETIQDGVFFEVQGVHLPDGRIGIELDLLHTDLLEPVTTRQITVDPSLPPFEVAFPVVQNVSADARVVLVPGTTVLLTSVGVDPDNELAVFATVGLSEPPR